MSAASAVTCRSARLLMTTSAPASARTWAMPLPIPRPAPVTNATIPLRSYSAMLMSRSSAVTIGTWSARARRASLPDPVGPRRNPEVARCRIRRRAINPRPSPSGLARLHADSAVEPDGLAVQHDVLHDVDGERRVFQRLAEAGREGDLLAERHARCFGEAGQERRVEQPGGDGADADAQLGQI